MPRHSMLFYVALAASMLTAYPSLAQEQSINIQGVELPGIPTQDLEPARQAESTASRRYTRQRSTYPDGFTQSQQYPLELDVDPGLNEIVSISRGYLNRIVTPFETPAIKTANNVQTHIESNIIYVATDDDRAIGLFIEPAEGGPAISLSLIPKSIPPREIRLRLPNTRFDGAVTTAKARRFETGSSYVSTIKKLLSATALGDVPPGYTLQKPSQQDAVDFYCPLENLGVEIAQVLDGHAWRLAVNRVRNDTYQPIEIREADCLTPNVLAVAAYPSAIVQPGAEAELYIVRKRAPAASGRPERPYVFTE
ncbi:MAG: type-F conjugative transfer system secretin TraK [Salinisphaeraceae bacterium]